jgi:hypothetical protein
MKTFPHVEDYLEILSGQRIWPPPVIPPISLARYDVNVIRSMTEALARGLGLTDRQAELSVRLLEKYRRQLSKAGVSVDEIIASPKFRVPLRAVDRTARVWIDGDTIKVKFPYQVNMVKLAREYSAESCGRMDFDHDKKEWVLGMTEHNVVWAVTWAQAHELEVAEDLAALHQLVVEAEKTPFEIVLELDETGSPVVRNAEQTLLDYIAANFDPLDPAYLTKLVDHAGILGYTVSDKVLSEVDPLVARIGLVQNVHQGPTIEHLVEILQYAKAAQRLPVMIFCPNRPFDDGEFLPAIQSVFARDEIAEVDIGGNIKGGKPLVCADGKYCVKVVYAKKLPRADFMVGRVPLFVTYNEMLYGSTKQVWLTKAERIAYMTETKLRN